MDKLRALQYLAAAASEGSLSGAGRRLEVSVPAVAKLINALERHLGQRLLERAPGGMALTSVGARYLEACAPALARLEEADIDLRADQTRPSGTLVVGVQRVVASGCLAEALPRFHALYPDIHLDVRDTQRATDESLAGLDIAVALGWPVLRNVVQRQIAAGRFLVAASPDYWAEHGMPQRPSDLAGHVCLPIRAMDGTLMDLWTFERGAERESVVARGWLVASNSHRDLAIDLALAGHGVVRPMHWTNRREFASGALVPALTDWQSPDAPPVNLFYPPSMRRVPRVRAFIDFVTSLFNQIDAEWGGPVAASERPLWMRGRYARASELPDGRREPRRTDRLDPSNSSTTPVV